MRFSNITALLRDVGNCTIHCGERAQATAGNVCRVCTALRACPGGPLVDALEIDGAAVAGRGDRTGLKSGRCSRRTVHAIPDLTSHQAPPQRLGRLAGSRWAIENRLHFVRDTTFREDASKIRTGHGPENMATPRNPAINRLRRHGHRNIAAGLRHISYDPFNRPLDLLNIPCPQPIYMITETLKRPWITIYS